MIRVAVLLILTANSFQVLAQANRAPWVAPFITGGARPGNFSQAPALAGGFSQAPAMRPYMGTSGFGSYGFQRPRPYRSPWGYNQGHYGQRPGFGGGNSILGSLLSGLFGMFGGNNYGYGNNGGGFNLGNLFGGNQFGGNQSFAQNYTPSQDYYAPSPMPSPALFQPHTAPDVAPPLTSGRGRSDIAQGGDDQFSDLPPITGPRNPADDAVQVVPDTLTPGEQLQVRAINDAERAAQSAPIWQPFIRQFQRCAPGCVPIQYSALRNSSRSCHGGGRALDLFGMRCPDGTHMARQSGPRNGKFAQLVQCLSEGRINRVQRLGAGQLGCLWHNKPHSDETDGHRDHVHVTIGCHGGRRW